MLNNVNILGWLCETPELKTTPGGVSVTSFTLAVDRDYKKGAEKQADFIPVVAWRNTAEFITKYFVKGQLAIISGALQTRKYKDKDTGKNRAAFEVIAEKVYFAANNNQSRAEPQEDSAAEFTALDIQDSGDLPF